MLRKKYELKTFLLDIFCHIIGKNKDDTDFLTDIYNQTIDIESQNLIQKILLYRCNIPTALAAEWPAEAELFESENFMA
jgi:hypothetical protein